MDKSERTLVNRRILGIAVPSIISNVTIPLLGLVDVTIVGHLGSSTYIGAIAVGTMIFNIICWVFGFLRMGTGGMTSQAYGRRDLSEVTRLLCRALIIGFGIGLCFIALQGLIERVAFMLVHPQEDVKQWTVVYFRICVWGIPAILCLYGLSGWFIGMQNSRIPMVVAISQNMVNILASLCFVFGLDMKVEGVAYGTLVAQYFGLLLAVLLWIRFYSRLGKYTPTFARVFNRRAMWRFFTVNRDIFFRTLCLVAVTSFFTSTGAAQGTSVLAVNTLLMQFFMLFSYVMDGFAYAAEALSGRYMGAGNASAFSATIRALFIWGGGMVIVFTAAYALAGNAFLGLMTNETEIIEASSAYFHWVLLIPLTSVAAFVWDGVYIGITATKQMFYSMLVASLSFFLVYYLLHDRLGNHALWLAFIVYLFLRGLGQTVLGKGVIKKVIYRA